MSVSILFNSSTCQVCGHWSWNDNIDFSILIDTDMDSQDQSFSLCCFHLRREQNFTELL